MTDWRARARAIAAEAGIHAGTFERQIDAESGYEPDVIACRRDSPAGAKGIAQIVSQWHPSVDPCDPEAALAYAARWMRELVDQYGSYRLALAAYNAGPGNVVKYGGVPPFAETRAYLSKILGPVWAEPEGKMPTEPHFDPTVPPILQTGDWQCSIGTASWMLHAIGRRPAWDWIQGAMSPRWVTPELGLLDASGRGIVEFFDQEYPEYRELTNFDAAASWDEIAAMAGTRPLGLGLRNWAGPGKGHWSAVRGITDGALVLANPGGTGPLYGQQTIDRAFVEGRGPASMVWIKTPVEAPQPPETVAPVSNTEALIGALAYVCDDLGDQLGAVRKELKRVREQFIGARG